MSFNKLRLGLLFTRPMRPVDWRKLDISGVKLAMVTWKTMDAPTLREFRRRGVKVLARLTGPDMEKSSLGEAQGEFAMMQDNCDMEAIQFGVEPDHGLDFHYGSPTGWGVEPAYEMAYTYTTWARAFARKGVQVLSPSLEQRTIAVEDWGFEPGQVAYARACADGFGQGDGCGVHIYMYEYPITPKPPGIPPTYLEINEVRFRAHIAYWAAMWHKPIWIDEINVNKKGWGDVQRMTACMNMARLLRDEPGLGARVEFFCPFVSSGYPESGAYDPAYIMEDEAAYAVVRQFMEE